MRRFLQNIHWSDKLIDILVVVLGITIAFGLNNWNEHRQNAKLEQKYLKSLREDLVKDSVNLQGGFIYMDKISFSINRIFRLGENKDSDSISYYFQALGDDYLIFRPEDYTYDALRQTGDINIIQRDTIVKTLSQLYDTYELFQIQVELAWRYNFDLLLPYYYNRNFRTGSVYDDTLYYDHKFQNSLIFYNGNLNNRQELMLASLRIIRQLIQLIDEELDE